MRAPVGGRQQRSYIAGRQLIAKSFAQNRPFTKICPAPSASWSLILKMKKLLNDSLDLTWRPSGGKKWCGFTPPMAVFAGECANADIYQELLRQHVVPWVQRDVAWRKIRPSAVSAPANTLKSVSGCGRILVFGGLAAIFAELEFAGLLNQQPFFGQKNRLRLTLIWRPYVHQLLQNNTGKRRYRSAKHAAATKPSLRNMK
jgi:hypothetical protein